MCRWVGYFGSPLRLEELVYNTSHSLIEQSRSARQTSRVTNADGFGLGWYGTSETPGVYHSVSPAWSDRNLQELAAQIESPLFLAHVRASTGTPVQQTNCHPFRWGRWLFVHNGFVRDYARLRRDLLLAVDPRFFGAIEGTTDSELLFYLALTFGLDDDALPALERMAGFVEATAQRFGIEDAVQMTLGLSDGERLYAVRYASASKPNSLYVSNDARDVQLLHPKTSGSRASRRRIARSSRSPSRSCPGSGESCPRQPPSSCNLAPTRRSRSRPVAPSNRGSAYRSRHEWSASPRSRRRDCGGRDRRGGRDGGLRRVLR
jgi:glutamine amidotransferase